ncbi:sodium-dependent bicarbonate transport family permease [uncultured Shimia sp.]|uniref:sodium-dependent bicarbonate transport family permease n=1 Tax=uncultured Shimia sp. TaxID=573152 RepID=UPI002623832A|nr:sodium-dependent bicarbonate transport family permease [uncultured Shimia sp.]
MDSALSMLADNLLVPTILFFVLGLVAAVMRSDLSIPVGAANVMSIYLLFAIGFKGGVSVSDSGASVKLFATMAAGAVLSFVMPFLAYALLRAMTNLTRLDAAAVAGHYGSISIVTFVTAVNLLQTNGISFEGYMVAVAAVMEVPAILSALWLVARGRSGTQLDAKLMRDILANGSIVLLVGAFLIGAVTGKPGLAQIDHFIVVPFTGVLCLFLLDMGLNAGRSLMENRREITLGLVAFGCVMPVAGSLLGFGLAALVGLSQGGTFLFMTLAASASYIAVPAAMRIAVPEAKAGVYLSAALGVTFPFNLTIGLPLYAWIANCVV